MENNIKNIKFEDAIKELEIIVEKMESGDLELDESVALYSKGMELSKICSEKLEEAKKKVQIVTDNGAGEKKLEDFAE